MNNRVWIMACVLLCSNTMQAQDSFWMARATGVTVSLRGVATARHTQTNDTVVWASGAKGTVIRSIDQGVTWSACGPRDYSELDYRSIHAWNERDAIVASAGTPAVVLRTSDSGTTWKQVVRNHDPKAFFDGLRFIDDQRGVLFGDPVDQHFLVMTTMDGGHHWTAIDGDRLPKTLDKEAAFAASNSAMLVAPPSTIWIGTGGVSRSTARVHRSLDFGATWDVIDCPLTSDESSGIFSLARGLDSQLIAVGGDYRPDAQSNTTGARSVDLGQSFRLCTAQPTGYRSAVVYLPASATNAQDRFIACGPAGTDWSEDGDQWKRIDSRGYHALAVTPDGHVVAVGSDGRCAWSKSGL